MYSLNCDYFDHEFDTRDELIEYIIDNAMDPSYEITKNGILTGEYAIDLIIL